MNTPTIPPAQPALRSRNLWPYAIIGWFVLFISAAVAFVAFAARHPMALVSQTYYEEEILYQQRIDNIKRARAAGASVLYHSERDVVSVSLPRRQAGEPTTGEIQLYRPSDPNLDRRVPLSLDAAGEQQIDLSSLPPGLWKVQVEWQSGGQPHYIEQPLIKPAPPAK